MVGEHLDPGEDGIRCRARTRSAKARPRESPLASDDVLEEGASNGARAPSGEISPIRRHDVGCDRVTATGRGQPAGDLVGGLGIARDDNRGAQAGPGQRIGVVQQDRVVATVGPADEEHEVGSHRTQRANARRVETARTDVHHAPAGRQRHAPAGLGRDLEFLPDDGDAAGLPGTAADQRLGGFTREASARHTAARPCITSVATVVGWAAVATRDPSSVSTSTPW